MINVTRSFKLLNRRVSTQRISWKWKVSIDARKTEWTGLNFSSELKDGLIWLWGNAKEIDWRLIKACHDWEIGKGKRK